MRYLGTGTASGNGKSAPPPPEPPPTPTAIEAAELAEEESRPDGTDGGAVTP
jgi:hypothetical protein